MKRVFGAVLLVAVLASPCFAQQSTVEADIKRAVPYSRMLREFPSMTFEEYNDAVRTLARERTRQEVLQPQAAPAFDYLTPQYQTPPIELPSNRRQIYETPSYQPPSYSPPSSRTTYDWQSGNTYTTRKRYNGDTDVNGVNLNTGSTWNTTIKPNGSMNGTDSKMNPWTYDSRTKTYMNYGTGQMCVGEGAARTCF